MIRPILIVCMALCAGFFSGCKDKQKEERRIQLREIMHGNTPDEDMKAAMEKAKATVGEFLGALQKPAAGQEKFLVRKAFPRQAANSRSCG